MHEFSDRIRFLNLAALFEGSLIGVAFFVGWLAGVNPLGTLRWDWTSAAWGAGAAIPLFLLFVVSQWYPAGPLSRIKEFLTEMLGPPLAACRWYDLLLLSILVGFSEEILFRGVLQPWLEDWWGWIPGLIGCSVLFGLAHSITPLYAIVATATGVYLGLLLDIPGERNLLAPIVAHGFYDFLAFLIVVRSYRQQSGEETDSEKNSETAWEPRDEPFRDTDPD